MTPTPAVKLREDRAVSQAVHGKEGRDLFDHGAKDLWPIRYAAMRTTAAVPTASPRLSESSRSVSLVILQLSFRPEKTIRTHQIGLK